MALLLAVGRPTAALAVIVALPAVAIAWRRAEPAGRVFAAWLLALGFAVVAGTEVLYLRDFLDGGDWRRMNTVFKFGVPAWLFLGLAGAVVVWEMWRGVGRSFGRALAPGIALLLVGAGLLFLPLGIPARVDDRFPGARPPIGTLDATAYMTLGQYNWPDGNTPITLRGELEAIRWLLDNVDGTPVIAEAPAGQYVVNGESAGYDYYRAGGLRVASLTGLPTFVGHHQYEQRAGDQVSERIARGQEFYKTTDIARTRELLRALQVRYIYVGVLERILFSPDSLRKFDVMADNGDLEVVYENDDVRIYRVLPSGSGSQ